MKVCPVCHRELPDDVAFCDADGHRFAPDDARTLGDLARAEAPLAPARALDLALALADLVARAAPARPWVHPDDVALGPAGEVRSLTNDPGADLDRAAPYAPLEALQKRPATPASAVYSLGAVLYELLAGAPPFRGTAAAVVVRQTLERPRPPSGVAPALAALVLRALDRDPAARPASPAAFAAALRALPPLASVPLGPPAPLGAPPPAPAPRVSAPAPAPGGSAPGAAPSPYGAQGAAFSPPPSAAQPMGAPTAYGAPHAAKAPAPRGSRVLVVLAGLTLLGFLVALASMFTLRAGQDAPPQASRPAPNTGVAAPPVPTPTLTQPVQPTAPPTPMAPTEPRNDASPPTSDAPPTPAPVPRPSDAPPAEAETPDDATYHVALALAVFLGVATLAAFVFVRRRARANAAARSAPPPVPPPVAPTIVGSLQQPTPPPETAASPFAPPVTPPFTPSGSPWPGFPPADTLASGDAFAHTVPATPAPGAVTPRSLSGARRCPTCSQEFPDDARFCPLDGARLSDAPSSPAAPATDAADGTEPFVVGQYRCFARLGQGGMGVVYKARHVHLDRLAAVKVLLPGSSRDARAVEMFRREARLASSINHPNSVTIYDYGEVGESMFYLAMEYIQGRTLGELVRREPLPVPRALAITRQVCDGLDVAHAAGIVHRDLKPANLMVCERPGRGDLVKILDFGIARSVAAADPSRTLAGGIVGTPGYMSPEQARGEPDVDARSDVFSLGLIVYQMLTATLPFDTERLTPLQQVMRRATLKDPPLPAALARPGVAVPPHVEAALAHALTPDRDRRTPSVAAFASELGLG